MNAGRVRDNEIGKPLSSRGPRLHPPPERISPDPDAPLQALAKSIWCSASSSPGNTRARPRTSSRKLRRTLVLFANIATPASHDIPEDKDPERVTFFSVRDRRGPDLALERDHEGRPDERGNTCPAPTRLRRPQGLEDPAPHEAPAETEDDVPEQPVPSALHGDPGQPAGHHSDENRPTEHFEMHDSFSSTGLLRRRASRSRLTCGVYHDINYISNKKYINTRRAGAGRGGAGPEESVPATRRTGVKGSTPDRRADDQALRISV